MEWMDIVIGFVAGMMFNWWFLIFCFCSCLWCEHRESSGWAVFYAILLGLVVYFFFSLTWSTVWPYFVGYVPVGFVWSFWRWKRHVDRVASRFETDNKERNGGLRQTEYMGTREYALQKIDLKENIGRVTYWVLMWPFSLLEQFVGDLIDLIERVIHGIANATYNKISARAASRIKAVDVDESDSYRS